MTFETLRVEETAWGLTVTLHRPAAQNALNATLLRELRKALDWAERDPRGRLVVLQGAPGVFSTGLDFAAPVGGADDAGPGGADYMATLKRLSESPKIVIAKVDGRAVAGGVGLAAACDLVVATSRAKFALTEALWGLLPCCVLPFLIRRIGYQKAYAMTLTTRTVEAAEAERMGLVDQLHEDPDEALRLLRLRLEKLDEATIRDLKAYFRKNWILDEALERTAVAEIDRLAATPRVRENIRRYVTEQKFPWDSR
jgi:polyketide biosynthesis enoyl-CoA hydratase PksH